MSSVNKVIHLEDQTDLMGNFVDGWYWILLEDEFRENAKTLQGQPRAIVDRLIATVHDVPGQLIAEQQGFWNGDDSDIDSPEADGTWDKLNGTCDKLMRIHAEMIEEIAAGRYAPENATHFVWEFIRRVTGTRPS